MNDHPETRPSLLVRLRDSRDADAWRAFVELYSPVLYAFARRHRLQDADAADLTQDVLRGVSSSVGRLDYDRQRGRFRGWLLTLAHRRLADFLSRRRRETPGSGDSAVVTMLEEVPAEDEQTWDAECEQRVFAWAAERVKAEVKPATWDAFWKTAVEGKAGAAVAAEVGLSVGAVYVARSRVQARLKELVEEAREL